MEENENKDENINNVVQDSDNNMDIFKEINNLEELDDEEEKNEDLIQDLIKQGKYFDVIKYLESKDNKKINIKKDLNGDNGIINNNEEEDEELKIIPADDISDLHEDLDNNNNESREDIKIENVENINKNDENQNINNDEKKNKENEETNKNNLDKDEDIKKNEEIKEAKIENNKINQEIKETKNESTNLDGMKVSEDKKISKKENEKNISNNNINKIDKENISPKELIKEIISSENNKVQKSQTLSQDSSKSISLLHLSFEEEQEANNYYEERLKEIQQERKIFNEKNNININDGESNDNNNKVMNNLELLTKELQELNELENNENEDLNGIDQMNEMYRMIQEDKEGNILQEKRREKLFPFYKKANCDIKDEIKNEYFKNINLNNIRNFFISSKILDNKNILKRKNYNINKYNIEYPKSVFDDLKFDKSDIKEFDYEEYLDEFLEDKKNTSNLKIIKNNFQL